MTPPLVYNAVKSWTHRRRPERLFSAVDFCCLTGKQKKEQQLKEWQLKKQQPRKQQLTGGSYPLVNEKLLPGSERLARHEKHDRVSIPDRVRV